MLLCAKIGRAVCYIAQTIDSRGFRVSENRTVLEELFDAYRIPTALDCRALDSRGMNDVGKRPSAEPPSLWTGVLA